MARFGLIICLLAGLANAAEAENRLSQEELAMRITELAYGNDETASDVQLGYSGRFGTVWVSLEIIGCMARIQQYSDISDVKVLIDMMAEFDLNEVYFVKGRDYSSSVATSQGFSESRETDQFYTYSTTANSDRIVANITFKRNDGANFEYEGMDYAAHLSPLKLHEDDLNWVPLQSPQMVLIILNPRHEKQLQLLVSSIEEYRQRFCMLVS